MSCLLCELLPNGQGPSPPASHLLTVHSTSGVGRISYVIGAELGHLAHRVYSTILSVSLSTAFSCLLPVTPDTLTNQQPVWPSATSQRLAEEGSAQGRLPAPLPGLRPRPGGTRYGWSTGALGHFRDRWVQRGEECILNKDGPIIV